MTVNATPKCGFKTSLDLRSIDNGRWILISDLVYRTEHGERIVVPAGFKTNLTSVPRFLWSILPPTGNYMSAAVLHDYLYYAQDRERSECDSLLNEAMHAYEKVGRLARWVIYRGVKYGGGSGFAKHANNKRVREMSEAGPRTTPPTFAIPPHNGEPDEP